jgi:hypothetical protein
LATRESASNSSFDSLRRSTSFSKKVSLLTLILLHLCLIIHLSHSQGMKRNPVYFFYEPIDFAADGSPGKPGNKHYRCLHSKKGLHSNQSDELQLEQFVLMSSFYSRFHVFFFHRSYRPSENPFQAAA